MGHGESRKTKALTVTFACYILSKAVATMLSRAAVPTDQSHREAIRLHDNAGRAGAAARLLFGPLETVLVFFRSPKSLMTISQGTQSHSLCAAFLTAAGNRTSPDARSTASTGTTKVRKGTLSGTTALGITKAPRAMRGDSAAERRPRKEAPSFPGGEPEAALVGIGDDGRAAGLDGLPTASTTLAKWVGTPIFGGLPITSYVTLHLPGFVGSGLGKYSGIVNT